MLGRIIGSSLKNRFLVFMATALLIVAGTLAVKNISLDAIPDLSDVQVIIFTEFPGQAPQVVEDQVTYPLTTSMLAVPHSKVVRGYSFFGFSFVYIIFEDGTDMYWARSRVLEYLNYAAKFLPKSVTPTLGPDATGVGWVYEYAIVDKTGKHDLSELRSIQDWYLRYALQTVPGVSEVAAVGGYVKQYQVEVDPNKLVSYHISLAKVKQAIRRSNNDVGGRLLEMAESEFMVRALGYIKSIKDLKNIAIGVDNQGTAIYLRDVAQVHTGPELRRGLAELNGTGEVAGGIIIMRYQENALKVIKAVEAKLEELKGGLPDGVEIVPTYNRKSLIERAVDNLKDKLLEEFIVISLVCMLFLMHARSALVAIITLPLGVMIAFILMQAQGMAANIMSLGGIAITLGAMVDGAIVMIENAHKHLEHALDQKKVALPPPDDPSAPQDAVSLTAGERWAAVATAAKEVGPALFFSLVIITVSYAAIFTLEAQEGRLFKPLAFTASYAMAASALLAVTLVPVLMGYMIRGKIMPEAKNPVNRMLTALHRPMIHLTIKGKWMSLLLAVGILLSAAYPLSRLGSEFMPPLDEGDILYMPSTFPGISITKAKELLQQTDRILKTFPEVKTVFGKAGRADTSTDPAPLSMMETILQLKPRSEWPNPKKTTRELMHEMDKAIHFPGLSNAWTYPIKTRNDMLSTGIKTPIGIKVSGPNLVTLQRLSEEIEGVIKGLPDTLSAFGDRAVGGHYVDFNIKRTEIARYGLTVGDVEDVIQSAIGGMNVTQTVEGLERYPVNVRYPRAYRNNLDTLKRVLVSTPTGAQVPLEQLTDIRIVNGPPSIKSEAARPNAWIYVDITTSDIGGYVARAKKLIATQVKMPAGYTIAWSGQFEYMERAQAKMQIVIPLTLVAIFLLLYFNFHNLAAPVVVMLAVPFGMVGGFWLVYWMNFNMSVAVAVGFIALAGVAAEIGVLVLTFVDQEVDSARKTKGTSLSAIEIMDAVKSGTGKRVRPIAMTAAAVVAGLVPILWGSGTGSDVMKRIAAPMVGGMVTTTLLCLLVLPLIYGLILQFKEQHLTKEDT